MQMSPADIKKEYLEAKNKIKIIGVLADLNTTTPKEIKRILEGQGVELSQKKKAEEKKMEEKKTEKQPEKEKEVPEIIAQTITDKIASLGRRIEITNQMIREKEEGLRTLKEDVEKMKGDTKILEEFLKAAER